MHLPGRMACIIALRAELVGYSELLRGPLISVCVKGYIAPDLCKGIQPVLITPGLLEKSSQFPFCTLNICEYVVFRTSSLIHSFIFITTTVSWGVKVSFV